MYAGALNALPSEYATIWIIRSSRGPPQNSHRSWIESTTLHEVWQFHPSRESASTDRTVIEAYGHSPVQFTDGWNGTFRAVILVVMTDITQMLSEIEHGNPSAAEQLLPLVYEELRKLAAAKLANEKPGHTLQATALVHDAYLRLVDVEKAQHWESRGHFFGAAAEAMRRILVESARRKQGPKRGGNRGRVELDEAQDQLSEYKAKEVLDVHDALDALEEDYPAAARLVKLRYFGGMTQQEAADCLGISRTTADRYWVYAKATMFSALKDTSQ